MVTVSNADSENLMHGEDKKDIDDGDDDIVPVLVQVRLRFSRITSFPRTYIRGGEDGITFSLFVFLLFVESERCETRTESPARTRLAPRQSSIVGRSLAFVLRDCFFFLL